MISRLYSLFGRIRNTLAFPLIGLLVLVASATLASSYFMFVRAMKDSYISSNAEKAGNVNYFVRSFIEEEARKLPAMSKMLKRNLELSEALMYYFLTDGRSGELKRQMEALYPNLNTEIFVATDNSGVVAHDMDSPGRIGKPYEAGGIERALSGEDSLSTSVVDGEWAIRAMSQVVYMNEPTGAIVVGTRINDDFARKIASATNTQISLLRMDSVLASSLPRKEVFSRLDLSAARRSIEQNRTVFVEDQRNLMSVLYSPLSVLNETFCLVIQVDNSSSSAMMARQMKNTMYFFIFIMVLTLALGSKFAIALLFPLKQLKFKAESIAREYSGKPFGEVAGNEVQSLIRSFDMMTSAINDHITELRKVKIELTEARDAAEKANHAKSFFLANMSHEIRTPMNAIMGMTDLTLETRLTPEQREYLEIVKHSSESLLKLIDEVLDFSRIEAGKIELERLEFDLADTVKKAISTLSFHAYSKDLDLFFDIDGDVPLCLMGDAGRLRQVLINLMGNALKFTDRGEVALRVALVPPGADGDGKDTATLRFTISDTGIGIPQDSLKAIFESFTQYDSSYGRKYGGAGLGLSISRKIVSLMGGEIWAESEVGKGSTFRFTASFALATKGAASAKQDDGGQGTEACTVAGERLKVLVAEDNEVNQILVSRILTKSGFTVALAATGKKALEAIVRERFDIVLMDMQMPDMDGIETTHAIRNANPSEVDTSIPIIALTAHAMEGDRERFLKAGMNDYVAKPVKAATLIETIRRHTICRMPREES